MPTVSKKQERFMQAVAHNPAFAKKVGVPVKVGKEFTKSGGGEMKESKAMVKKEVSFMKKKGAPKSMIKHEMKEAGMKKMASGGLAAGHKSADGIAMKGKTKGKEVKMALGGFAMGAKKMGPINPNAVRPGSTPKPMPGSTPRPVPPPPGLSRPQNPSTGGGLKQIVPSKMAQQQLTAKHAAQVQAMPSAQRAQYDAQKARAFADYQKQREAQQKLDAARPTGNAPMGQTKVYSAGNIPMDQRPKTVANFTKNLGKKAGGLAAGHKQADGIAKKGKTKAMQVKMAGGGKTKKYC
jgi:hypothetical protein